MSTDIPMRPEREVRVVFREDNSSEHHHTFKSYGTTEEAILLDGYRLFEALYGGIAARDGLVIIVNHKELGF